MQSEFIKISGHIENYHWGKKGSKSLISKLLSETDENSNYAELWFGMHAKGPSRLSDRPENLLELISRDPKGMLGVTTAEKFANALPFLLKVLSIDKPLSIQLHPDKDSARQLHSADSRNYPDSNHKPELAIALSEVHLLYGFRPFSEIRKFINECWQFQKLIPPALFSQLVTANKADKEELLADLYARILTSEKSAYEAASKAYLDHLNALKSPHYIERLIINVAKEYGFSDPAIFSIPLMNYQVMQPGQALFIGPNQLHAYLSGDLLECMASSDNVIRAGMTPKFKDYKQLLRLVDFKTSVPQIIDPVSDEDCPELLKYTAECSEFRVSLLKGDTRVSFPPNSAASLVFLLEGDVSLQYSNCTGSLKAGEASFIPPANEELICDLKSGIMVHVTVPAEA